MSFNLTSAERDVAHQLSKEVIIARLAVGLDPKPFQDFGAAVRHGEPIVCKCVHCGKLFASASPDLADVEYICKGDCGCKR